MQSAAGPWVVQPDGSRRLLGDYGEATWSPNGLFVAAAAGRTLTAVEPDGTPHWSLTAPGPVTDPRWSPGRYRIAYRAGDQLRVTAADGTGDHRLARGTAPVAPAWSPLGACQLAYVEGGVPPAPRLRIADSESGERLGSAPALAAMFELEWGDGGRSLLEASRSALRLRPLRLEKLRAGDRDRRRRRLPLPAGARVEDAALAPRSDTVAAVVRTGHGRADAQHASSSTGAPAPRAASDRPRPAQPGRLLARRAAPAGRLAGSRRVALPAARRRQGPRGRRRRRRLLAGQRRRRRLPRGRGLVLRKMNPGASAAAGARSGPVVGWNNPGR